MQTIPKSASRGTFGARAPRAHARSGVALVMFAMLVFAFMGIAALTIDMGIASLTQAQMQNAADTASLEGVRLRDFGSYRYGSNKARRPRVSELVQLVFDDDLHPTSGIEPTPEPPSNGGLAGMPDDGPDELHVGAGPIWSLSGGEGEGNVGATLQPHHAQPVYDDPVLQTNFEDMPNGDMLSGGYSIYSNHTEQPGYVRDDYTPASPGVDSWKALGFLVRMRRTNGTGAPDNEPGVSTGGPALPFVFGLGTAMHAADGGSYNPRTEGLTVRAVAIAAARPATTIGPAPNMMDRINNPMLGVGFWYPPPPADPEVLMPPLALDRDFWYSLPLHTAVSVIRSGSTVHRSSNPTTVVGNFLVAGRGRSIGEAVLGAVPPDIPQSFATYSCYFPIYAPILDGAATPTDRIIGYGYGIIQSLPSDPPVWTVTKGFQNKDDPPFGGDPACAVLVAADNAGAHLTSHAPALSKVVWDQVFEAHGKFAYPAFDALPGYEYPNGQISFAWVDIRPGTVLAPVLVR